VQHIDPTVHPAGYDPRDNFGPYQVPAGSLFMMGDNRDNSNDSRFWGPVKMDLVKGRAMFIYFSTDGRNPLEAFGKIRFARLLRAIH
jgi:signal peptidase I